jgi:hypothetical protein
VSQEFIENVGLLVLTASLTGVLVPLIFRRIDERKFQRQKTFEAELARQNTIIDAQAKFIERLSDSLWEYQLLALVVTYYYLVDNQEIYNKVAEIYYESTAPALVKIRSEISKSLRLVPLQQYKELKRFYYEELLMIEQEVTTHIEQERRGSSPPQSSWSELNQKLAYSLSDRVDKIINDLAEQLDLRAHLEDRAHSIPDEPSAK